MQGSRHYGIQVELDKKNEPKQDRQAEAEQEEHPTGQDMQVYLDK